ncbi:unnamed protein product [Lactuca saligna]|uniref:Cdc6/ORC1-like ATPase lid domain-containing protein n=1 Tax=Lactuca saligna TaxID=75948 RepID=A0AA35Z7I9_LACSI|nr:unnamed protein product [Lactuca saligna]
MWPISECPIKITPPLHHNHPGRPNKKRKQSVEEKNQKKGNNGASVSGSQSHIASGSGKLTRNFIKVTCSKCKNKGHDAKTCRGQGERKEKIPPSPPDLGWYAIGSLKEHESEWDLETAWYSYAYGEVDLFNVHSGERPPLPTLRKYLINVTCEASAYVVGVARWKRRLGACTFVDAQTGKSLSMENVKKSLAVWAKEALPYTVFQPQALELCARKVAASSGDMRKALGICRGAIERLEAELRESISTSNLFSMEELEGGVKTLSQKLSAALLNINSKEDLVKHHSKVAEEAVEGI